MSNSTLNNINNNTNHILYIHTEKEEAMFQCCSWKCTAAWFHLSCTHLDAVPDGDWYCSDSCANDGTYAYCVCHERLGGQMIQCHKGHDCLRSEWYPVSCLGNLAPADTEGKHH